MKKLFEQIVKFGIVGAIAFVIDYAVLFVLVQFLHMDSIIAATISFTVSVIFNYLASMKYVFVGRADQSKQTQFIIFIVLSVIGLGINDGIMWILNGILSPFIPTYYYLVSKIVATAIVMVWNFVSRKIFLEEKNQGMKMQHKGTKNPDTPLNVCPDFLCLIMLCNKCHSLSPKAWRIRDFKFLPVCRNFICNHAVHFLSCGYRTVQLIFSALCKLC